MTVIVSLRATPAELRRWRAAARAQGRTLSAWLRWVAAQALRSER